MRCPNHYGWTVRKNAAFRPGVFPKLESENAVADADCQPDMTEAVEHVEWQFLMTEKLTVRCKCVLRRDVWVMPEVQQFVLRFSRLVFEELLRSSATKEGGNHEQT